MQSKLTVFSFLKHIFAYRFEWFIGAPDSKEKRFGLGNLSLKKYNVLLHLWNIMLFEEF